MPMVSCIQCKKAFYTKPFWIKKGNGKFCSLVCKYAGTRKGKMVACSICGQGFYRKQSKLAHSKSGKYFCSKSCQTLWRNNEFVGPKHVNWVHGRNAYRSVLNRNKIPHICLLCQTTDYRILAVHHIDCNRLNNRLSNLAWLCHNCHFLVHHDNVEKQRFSELLAKR